MKKSSLTGLERWVRRLVVFLSFLFYFWVFSAPAQIVPVTVTRTISPRQVERGESFEVTLRVTANQAITGLGIDEDLEGFPSDWSPWQVTPITDDGAIFNDAEVQWLWLSLEEGEIKEVSYQVDTSPSATPGVYTISGVYSSELPPFEQEVTGDSTFILQDTQPPPAVTGFVISQGSENGEIDLSWDKCTSPDFSGILILRHEGSTPTSAPSDGVEYQPGENIGECMVVYVGQGRSYTDSGLSDNTVYYYKAFSFDDFFNYSEGVLSQPPGIIPRDTIPPDNVTSFQATGGDGKVILTWKNPEEDWKGTRIMRKEDSFPLTPYDGTCVYTGTSDSYVDEPLSNNTTYYYTAFAYDEVPNYSQAVSSAQDFATCRDMTPPEISHEPVECVTKGETLMIFIAVTDSSPLSSVSIYYRIGGETPFTRIPIQPDSSYQAAISGEVVTERGIDYYLEAEDIWGNEAFLPDPSTGISFFSVRVKTSILSFPFSTQKKKWQMISVPGELDDPSPNSILVDDLGTQDDTKWKLYHWNTTDKSYDEYPDVPDFTPGRSFWLITKTSKSLDVENITSVDTSKDYSISLASGWTQIACPFAFSVDLDDVKVKKDSEIVSIKEAAGRGWVRDIIWYWDKDSYIYYQAPSGTLQPWKGYWFKALTPCTLLVPPVESSDKTKLPSTTSKSKEDFLQIIAKLEDLKDTYNFIGFADEAKDTYDRLDIDEAPAISPYISLYFPHQDWGKNSGLYTQDIKKKNLKKDKITWLFEVKTSKPGKDVTLEWKNTQAIPETYSLFLTDEDENILVNMRETFSYSFTMQGEKERFKILAISEPLSPDKSLSLTGLYTYPNPTTGKINIHFNLETKALLNIKIYTLSGELVKTLAYHKLFQVGSYDIAWDGCSERGEKVAPGVYILLIRATNEKDKIIKTHKIAIQKN